MLKLINHKWSRSPITNKINHLEIIDKLIIKGFDEEFGLYSNWNFYQLRNYRRRR